MSCPCKESTPCSSMCSCVNSLSSYGCNNCASYGTKEQRRNKRIELYLRNNLTIETSITTQFGPIRVITVKLFLGSSLISESSEELE